MNSKNIALIGNPNWNRIANDKNSDRHVFNHCIDLDQNLSFFSFTDSKLNSNNFMNDSQSYHS